MPSVLSKIQTEVRAIASERGLRDDQAFGFWFLEQFEDMSAEQAVDVITDGPWDHGRDAVDFDAEAAVLKIYQFKYSEDRDYAADGFRQLQTGVMAESQKLAQARGLNVYLVTTCGDDFEVERRTASDALRTWLNNQGYSRVRLSIEVFGLHSFRQKYEAMEGIQVTLHCKSKWIESDGCVLGLADATNLKHYMQDEALFALNIRQALGRRAGSVNSEIMESLEDITTRQLFWTYNNGIVCLCSSYQPLRGSRQVRFENFTVVNGAQTLSTIADFLAKNPSLDSPIWVVAKVCKIVPTDLERARKLTKTSNSQTPTSRRDLRAVESQHKRLKDWYRAHLDVNYIYKRGERTQRGRANIQMKDIAQAYTAFWSKAPHVAFAQAGRIFSSDEYYTPVFPQDRIQELRERGDAASIRAFLIERMLPHMILEKARSHIKARIMEGDSQKNRSLAYHIVWLYWELLPMSEHNLEDLYANLPRILDETMGDVYQAISLYFGYHQGLDLPGALKNDDILVGLSGSGFLGTGGMASAKHAVHTIMSSL